MGTVVGTCTRGGSYPFGPEKELQSLVHRATCSPQPVALFPWRFPCHRCIGSRPCIYSLVSLVRSVEGAGDGNCSLCPGHLRALCPGHCHGASAGAGHCLSLQKAQVPSNSAPLKACPNCLCCPYWGTLPYQGIVVWTSIKRLGSSQSALWWGLPCRCERLWNSRRRADLFV